MSDSHDPQPPGPSSSSPASDLPPPYVIPVRLAVPSGGSPLPAPGSAGRSPLLILFLLLLLAVSFGVNLLLLFALPLADLGDLAGSSTELIEHLHSGASSARDKIAIIRLDGVIMEAANDHLIRQIDRAASDPAVKAVVFRVNSPGGTITGSDDLHRRIIELRDGTNPQCKPKNQKRTVVVSMGSMAASGGYYVSMPAEYIFAEQTTITGSIGVYVAFPNVADLAKSWGIGMEIIKAGGIKDTGSMFKHMTAPERRLWQDLVDQAFTRFSAVIEEGPNRRSTIEKRLAKAGIKNIDRKKILETIVIDQDIPDVDGRGKPNLDDNGKPRVDEDGKPLMVKYVRRLADGGIWTARDAHRFGLIDEIGYLDAAVKKTAELAQLSEEKYRVVDYQRRPTFADILLSGQAAGPGAVTDPERLAAGATPRLWYLAPHSELAGILTAIGTPERAASAP